VRERADMVIGFEEIARSLGSPGITLLDVQGRRRARRARQDTVLRTSWNHPVRFG